jgi:glycosyltransferase involved in cell wall biosynthesis
MFPNVVQQMDGKLKIFINAIAALQGGGVTYLNQLLSVIGKDKSVIADVYGFKKRDASLEAYSNLNFIAVDEAVYASPIKRYKYEKKVLSNILKNSNYDIAFFPSGTINTKVPTHTKSVTMFRNMLPFSDNDIKKFSNFKVKLRYKILKRMFLKSFKKADHVIFISNFAQSVIAQFIPEIKSKSSVIYHGINDDFRVERSSEENDSLLYVAILNEYKHHNEIIQGLKKYKDENGSCPKLRLVGYTSNANYFNKLQKEILDIGMVDSVEIVGPIDYKKLPELYKNSEIAIFGSTCENCPNILLESMATGIPILCSNVQPMPEFAEDSVIYFNPESPESFAAALKKIKSTDLVSLGKKSKEKSKFFSWNKTAENTLGTFQKLSS